MISIHRKKNQQIAQSNSTQEKKTQSIESKKNILRIN